MKTITINVSEAVYEDFRRAARRSNRPTSELIREAMRQYQRQHLGAGCSLRDFKPRSLGRVRKPLGPKDNLLPEMLDNL